MSDRPPARTEPGFTLIELIVGMILLAIALGMVGTAIIQGMRGSSAATSGATADASIARVVARFQDDLAIAETKDRADRLVREQFILDAALRKDANAASDDPSNVRDDVDLEDITLAMPNMIVFRANVDRTTPDEVECVTWEARVTGDTYEVIRTVRTSNPLCGGGDVIEEETLMRGRADATDAIVEPFSYDLLCHRTLCDGAPAATAPGAECAPWPDADVGQLPGNRRDLRRIVSVRAQFVTHAGREATQARSATAMSIRSRGEHMWRTALGC